MVDRFDNYSTADLVRRFADLTAERDEVLAAALARLVAECPIEIDKVYRVVRDRFEGRLMLARYVVVEDGWRWHRAGTLTTTIQGRLRFVGRGHPPTSDGFCRRCEVVLPENLEGPVEV